MGYGVTMRTRSYRHMRAEERETVSLGLAHGQSLRTMASVLGWASRTVNRELARNVTRGRPYDQSFVRRLGADDDALAIVKTIIVLAHQLGRQVIAEGVETAEQLTILRALGCEYGQGYVFAKPLPCADVPSFLASGRRW